MAKEIPTMYQKLLEYVKSKEKRVMASRELESELAQKFRLSKSEMREAIFELNNYGLKVKRTQRRTEIK